MRFLVLLIFLMSPKAFGQLPICKDFAKYTCDSNNSNSEKKYEKFVAQIQDKFANKIFQEFKTNPASLRAALITMGESLPENCPSNLTNLTCEKYLKGIAGRLSQSIENFFMEKPSVFSDPTVEKPFQFFDKYVSVAREDADQLFHKSTADIARIQILFEKVKTALKENVSKEIDEPARGKMIRQLNSITLNLNNCGKYGDAPNIIRSSAFYRGEGNEFSICPRLLLNSMTDAQLATILGHEMSHSIDPCRSLFLLDEDVDPKLTYLGNLGRRTYGSVLSCLRSDKSAAAERPRVPIVGVKHAPDTDLSRSEMSFFEAVCLNDQINESFADWSGIGASSKVIADWKPPKTDQQLQTEYGSVYATKCKDIRPDDPHPAVERRANGIMGVNPQVRSSLKCQGDPKYLYCQPPVAGSGASASQEDKGVQ